MTWKPGDPVPEGHGEVQTTEDGIYWVCKCGWKGRFLADLEDHYDGVGMTTTLKSDEGRQTDSGVIAQK